MDYYLLTLGYWNFFGSLLMIGFFNEKFGHKVLIEWTQFFSTEFKHTYWSRFWLAGVIGLNIFFGAINICSVYWSYPIMQQMIIGFDLVAYALLIGLAVWGIKAGRMGKGVYSIFIVFGIWLVWGVWALYSSR